MRVLKVLLVEDDPDALDITTYSLRREGFTVVSAMDGQQALNRWEADQPDIVLIDIGLPKLDGLEVCRQIRRESDTPVIFLTGHNTETDVVRGFQVDADDYIVKPFSPKVLVQRIQAVLRRCRAEAYHNSASELRVDDLVINLQSHEVTKGDQQIQLTPLEFRLFYLLAMNAGRVIPYSRLIQYAWGYDSGDALLLKTHIYHIRKKLGYAPRQKDGIRSVTGVGYSLRKS